MSYYIVYITYYTFLSACCLLLIFLFYMQRSSLRCFFFYYYCLHCLISSYGLVGYLKYVYGYRVCACALLRVKCVVKYHLGFVKHCVNSTGYREKGFKKWACGIVIKGGCLYCNGYLVPKGCEGPVLSEDRYYFMSSLTKFFVTQFRIAPGKRPPICQSCR